MKTAFKRRLSLIVAFAMVFSLSLGAISALAYSDVADGRWYAQYVKDVTDYGYMNGIGNDQFDPEGQLKNFHAALMIVRALGYTDTPTYTTPGGDAKQVASGINFPAWQKLYDLGIVATGTSVASQTSAITRGAFFIAIAKSIGIESVSGDIASPGSLADYASLSSLSPIDKGYIVNLINLNIVAGASFIDADGNVINRLNLDTTLTRAQAAKLFALAFGDPVIRDNAHVMGNLIVSKRTGTSTSINDNTIDGSLILSSALDAGGAGYTVNVNSSSMSSLIVSGGETINIKDSTITSLIVDKASATSFIPTINIENSSITEIRLVTPAYITGAADKTVKFTDAGNIIYSKSDAKSYEIASGSSVISISGVEVASATGIASSSSLLATPTGLSHFEAVAFATPSGLTFIDFVLDSTAAISSLMIVFDDGTIGLAEYDAGRGGYFAVVLGDYSYKIGDTKSAEKFTIYK